MPTYDYRCTACEEVTEVFHGIHETPKLKCPACGKSKMERLIGAGAGILFKGSGFYETDYRSQSYKDAAAKDTSSGTSTPAAESKAKPAKEAPKKAD